MNVGLTASHDLDSQGRRRMNSGAGVKHKSCPAAAKYRPGGGLVY